MMDARTQGEYYTKPPFRVIYLFIYIYIHVYRGADEFLARPGRKQANVSVRMAWISFGALPCRKRNLMTSRVSILLKSRASLTCFRACFLPGRAKDLSAPRCISIDVLLLCIPIVSSIWRMQYVWLLCYVLCYNPRWWSPRFYVRMESPLKEEFSVTFCVSNLYRPS